MISRTFFFLKLHFIVLINRWWRSLVWFWFLYLWLWLIYRSFFFLKLLIFIVFLLKLLIILVILIEFLHRLVGWRRSRMYLFNYWLSSIIWWKIFFTSYNIYLRTIRSFILIDEHQWILKFRRIHIRKLAIKLINKQWFFHRVLRWIFNFLIDLLWIFH